MTIRVFYDGKDFFGNTDYQREDYILAYSEQTVKAWTKKCMAAFGKVRCFSFRAEVDDEFYLVERYGEDEIVGTYTVTHRRSAVNIENPVKMDASAVKRHIMELFKKECAALDAA